MPTSNELRSLLGEVLRSQPNRPEALTVPFQNTPDDNQRLREAISGRQALTAGERRQLLHSPRARAQLVRIANELRGETRAHWRQAGVTPDIVYQAAAGDEVRPLSLDSNPDFGVDLYPLDPKGRRWTISLRLSARVMDGLTAGVRLRDSDGVLWLQGRPDSDGELSGDWALPESPVDRLRRCKLSLEPL